MTAPNRQPRLIHVRNPLKRVEMSFKPGVPLDGPVTDGPLIHVRHPLVRGTLTFVPVVTTEVELPLPPGANGGPVFETLQATIGKLNEIETLFDRPGVQINDERSGVRDGKVVIVLTPNDLDDAVETCKRVADYLFAAVGKATGVTVKVISADQPETPVYELAV